MADEPKTYSELVTSGGTDAAAGKPKPVQKDGESHESIAARQSGWLGWFTTTS